MGNIPCLCRSFLTRWKHMWYASPCIRYKRLVPHSSVVQVLDVVEHIMVFLGHFVLFLGKNDFGSLLLIEKSVLSCDREVVCWLRMNGGRQILNPAVAWSNLRIALRQKGLAMVLRDAWCLFFKSLVSDKVLQSLIQGLSFWAQLVGRLSGILQLIDWLGRNGGPRSSCSRHFFCLNLPLRDRIVLSLPRVRFAWNSFELRLAENAPVLCDCLLSVRL